MSHKEKRHPMRDFPGGSVVKNPLAIAGNLASIPGSDDPLGEGMAVHSSVLVWRVPWTEEPGRLQSMGPTELDTTETI